MSITALAPWFGSNRLLAENVGRLFDGCEHVVIPFAGGCCEVPHIKARTIVVNDLHRHVINLCKVVADPVMKPALVGFVDSKLFHPDELATCQGICRKIEEGKFPENVVTWAAAYFTCCWMSRSGAAGTPGEFSSSLAIRWNAGGGDSNVRFRSAIEALETFHRAMVDRCTFNTLDVFELLDKCHDKPKHGIYCDPPFLGPGAKYTHNAGSGQDELDWHYRLSQRLAGFKQARVVVRAYDTHVVRDFYMLKDGWRYHEFTGRKQTNDAAAELLIVRN